MLLHRVSKIVLAGAIATTAFLSTKEAAAQRTWHHVTTGNGHGFGIFDAQKNRITQFLEHPYRYMRSNPNDIKAYGVGRRNLAFDVYFGVKGGGGAGWLGEPTNAGEPEQFEQTGIIRAPATVAGVNSESFYFMPYGIERNIMVGVLKAAGGSDGYALLNFHMGGAGGDGTSPGADNENVRYLAAQKAIIETGPGGGAMVYVTIGGADGIDCEDPYNRGKGGQAYGQQTGCNRTGNDIAVGLQKKLGSDGTMGFVVGFIENANEADALAGEITTWLGQRSAAQVLDDAKKEWDTWRKPPPNGALCSDNETKVWRMGEASLRMGQVREKNIPGRKNNGMVLASLPIGQWHTGWVRDAAYAIVALARAGHLPETKMALDFFMNAEPVGKHKNLVKNFDYRVSLTRYFGSGEEESDWNPEGFNPQLDGWGLVLWASRIYHELANDNAWLDSPAVGGTVWNALTKGIAEPLEGNLESNGIVVADCSIWETHEAKKKHFAYTTLAAARGFCDMAAMAKKSGKGDPVKYQNLEKKVREAFLAQFVDDQGALQGNLEELSNRAALDGAVAEAFDWNILRDWKGNTAKQTLTELEKLLVSSGGYKRNDDGLSSYDNNEWILVDFRIANAYRRNGNGAKADSIVAKIVDKAAKNFYILPELYNATTSEGEIGKYFGEVPMVGYGGGAFIMTILDRAGIGEPDDCGDGQGSVLPKIDCSSVSTNPGGPGDNGPGANGPGAGGDGPPGADELPFVAACLCKTGPSGNLPPIYIAGLLAAPIALLVRRKRR